jgi:integrase
MTDPKSDPRRRCMRLAEWPVLDRDAWAKAIEDGDILTGKGPAAHWRPETRKSVISAYGRFLTFLERKGWLDRNTGPDARLTPDRLRAYLAELAENIAPVTISSRITGLAEALRVMVPRVAYTYLSLARRRLKARARPTRNKRARIVPTQQLVGLGLGLIQRADTGAFDREIWRACTYRDGITILLLACRPIRRSNLAAMELGKNLYKSGESYRIAFDGSETKNHRPYERPLDAGLTQFIDRYLEHYRPILLGPSASNHVWISGRHTPMSDCSLYGKIVGHTREAFGHAVCPHLFRDSAMTTLGEQEPEHVWLGMSLLHHTDPRIAEERYNHALASHAVQDYQEAVRQRRHRITRQRKRRRRGDEPRRPDRLRKQG